jgi:hypothetical protein
MQLLESQFWLGLGAIAGVNLVLSGDNAVVIALGARALPARQQRQVIIWGTTVAAVLRVMLTIVALSEADRRSAAALDRGKTARPGWRRVSLRLPEFQCCKRDQDSHGR